MSGPYQGVVPGPPPPPPPPQVPMGHMQGQPPPQPVQQVNPMMDQFRSMNIDPQNRNIAAHPSRIPQPINFPVTYEGWTLHKIPRSMLPPGEPQGWRRANRTPMPVDTHALEQQIKAKQKSRKWKTAMEEYNALKTDSLRYQVDRLIEDQTLQETNPHAEWKLASVETETRRLDSRSTEVGVLRVILKRQPKAGTRSLGMTMVARDAGFPGEIVDVQNPPRPKDPMAAAKFARSQQQPMQPQPQPQPQPLFDPMQRQDQGPLGPGWVEPTPVGFVPPPPPLPQQLPHPTQGMQQRPLPQGVTVIPQQQGPAGMSAKRPPQVQPIPIPQQGRPMTPQPKKKAKKRAEEDHDYDSESSFSDSDEIVEIVDEKIQKSKKVGEHGTTSKVKVEKKTQHSYSPPPMGVHAPKAPKKDYPHDQLPRRPSTRNLNRAPTPPVDHRTQQKVQKIVQEWHMAPDSSDDEEWRRADGGSSQFSSDSSRTVYTPGSSPRAPKATPYIGHRRDSSFDSGGRHRSRSPDHHHGHRPPHHRYLHERVEIVPSTSYRPHAPERRFSHSHHDRPRERPYLHQRSNTYDDYPGTVTSPKRLAATAAERDEYLADLIAADARHARYDRVRQLEAERAEEGMREEWWRRREMEKRIRERERDVLEEEREREREMYAPRRMVSRQELRGGYGRGW